MCWPRGAVPSPELLQPRHAESGDNLARTVHEEEEAEVQVGKYARVATDLFEK